MSVQDILKLSFLIFFASFIVPFLYLVCLRLGSGCRTITYLLDLFNLQPDISFNSPEISKYFHVKYLARSQ